MKALRQRAAVAPFLVSVNPTYGAGLGRRPPQEPKHRPDSEPGHPEAQRTLTASSHVERAGRVRDMLCLTHRRRQPAGGAVLGLVKIDPGPAVLCRGGPHCG
jgi:hypothetical protein